MLAAFAARADAGDPLAALEVGDRPAPEPPDGWVVVDVRAAALNHHDIWSLRGVGLKDEQLPMILGCDAAGTDPDGNEVIVHAVGRQAASAHVSSAGFGTTLRAGTTTVSARVPGCFSDSSDRRGSSVSSPSQAGSEITECTITSRPSASTPAASQPRIIGSRSAGRPTPRSDHRS